MTQIDEREADEDSDKEDNSIDSYYRRRSIFN